MGLKITSNSEARMSSVVSMDWNSVTGKPSGIVSGLSTPVASFLSTPSSANLATAITDETGSGSLVFATSPTLITPILGAATATTINKVTFTQPATGSTLTIADGKTATHSATTTFAGVDGKTMTINASLTLAGTDATTITFQGTDTYVGKATTDVLTNKTYDTAGTGNVFKINGVTISANTGTGSNVLATAPTISQPNLVGTTTNDSASVGSVGEIISSTVLLAAATALTTATAANITTVTLIPGDWDVAGSGGFTSGASSTTFNFGQTSISTTTATIDTTPERMNTAFYNSLTVFNVVGSLSLPNGPARFSLSTTTTVFLVGKASFAVSTCSAFGTLRARRVR